MVSVQDIVSKVPVLREIDPASADQIAALFSDQQFEPGEVIHRQGSPRERLVLIEEGVAEVTRKDGTEHGLPLMSYGPGDALGEGILLGAANHSTTCIAKTPVKALTADGNSLRAILDADPGLKAHIYHRVIQRLSERLDRLAPRSSPDALQLIPGRPAADPRKHAHGA